ncbi:LysR family transcriptional regulator [Streptomyces sp. NPDC093586]|uniref:LysR family transcriptional regulator n=1 Tax=Streptomyces sp. NPDC093586 TaxID=3366042 RepID=UPI0038044D5F
MELRHLEYFVAVVEESGFTRAAARLHVVQSAVSTGIQALERELGVRLLHRTSREVRLTEAGEAFLPDARETLASAQRALDAVDLTHGGVRGLLRIGTMTSVGTVDLPKVLGRLRRDHPRIALRLSTRPGGSRDLARALHLGELDVAILSVTGVPPRELLVTRLESTPMCVLVREDHALAGRDEVRLSDLAEESFVDCPVGYGSRTVVDRAFEDIGVTRQVALEVSDVADAADYVREGLGIAVVAAPRTAGTDGLRRLRIAGADLRWHVCVARSRDRPASAATRTFEAMLTEHGAVAGG